MASSRTEIQRLLNVRMVQNFHLVWLDGSIDVENDEDCRNSVTKLRQVVNTVNTFIDVDECIDFITDVNEKVFMIISGQFSQIIVPVVQNIPQIYGIYIYGKINTQHEKWAKEGPKVTGVYTAITPICELLEQAVQDCDHNSMSISFIKTTDRTTNKNLDELDSSFMYTQILKEILLTIDFKPQHFHEFLTYCRERFASNTKELSHVKKIQEEYLKQTPIWWYSYQCFLFSMLNRALRAMDIDPVIKMGFFARDLHNHIVKLHAEQYRKKSHSDSFTVYRGQVLLQKDFDQLKNTQGGLLAFNNFLSTTQKREVALRFVRPTMIASDMMGVLFVMTIDPSLSATPFADIKTVSNFQREEEILFSMHTVFRIGQIGKIKTDNRLWQVELILSGDNDPQLQTLTEIMREKTKGSTGWFRLGRLLMKAAQFDQAQQVFDMILNQTANEKEKGEIYYYVGWIKNDQGENIEALSYNEKALEIRQKTLPANHPSLATSYNNIGSVYDNMGEYSKALSYYEKALEIQQQTLPANHPHLAQSYSNIGLVHDKMGEYSKALSYYEKALEIRQKTLPANHPDLAQSYNNIGSVYHQMAEYSKAFSYLEKALEIFQKTLPANHPHLAQSYNNIGLVYQSMGKYSKALSYYEKALEIRQKTLPANHPDFANSYGNIGGVYDNMGEYSKALSYHEKALEIFEKTLPANHPLLASSYNNIGGVYNEMGKYSKALLSHEKAFEIFQKTLPANHPSLATSYHNIGSVYKNMGEYSKALSYYERALDIFHRSLPPNHPNLETVKRSIVNVRKKL